MVWQNKDRLLVYLTFSGQYFVHIQAVGNRGNDFCLPLESYGELVRNERFSLFLSAQCASFFRNHPFCAVCVWKSLYTASTMESAFSLYDLTRPVFATWGRAGNFGVDPWSQVWRDK